MADKAGNKYSVGDTVNESNLCKDFTKDYKGHWQTLSVVVSQGTNGQDPKFIFMTLDEKCKISTIYDKLEKNCELDDYPLLIHDNIFKKGMSMSILESSIKSNPKGENFPASVTVELAYGAGTYKSGDDECQCSRMHDEKDWYVFGCRCAYPKDGKGLMAPKKKDD